MRKEEMNGSQNNGPTPSAQPEQMQSDNFPTIFPPSQQTTTQTNTVPPTPQKAWTPPPPKQWHFADSDSVFAWIYLVFGFLFTRYLFFKNDSIVTTVFFLLLLVSSALSVKLAKKTVKLPQWILLGILALFTLPFSLSADPIIHTVNALFLLVGNAWWVRAVSLGYGFVTRYPIGDLFDVSLDNPLNDLDAIVRAMAHGFKKTDSGKKIVPILVGLLVTIPLTAVVAALLASADAGISALFKQIGEAITEDVVTIFWQFVLGFVAALYLFAALYSNRDTIRNPRKSDAEKEENLDKKRKIPNLGVYAGVMPICVLYLLYVISQLNYFCAAFSGILPENMETYAEYARRGFFELCWIAVINLAVILIMAFCAKQSGRQKTKALAFFIILLCVFTLFIIATAFAKMLLYIDAFGLTRKRIYTSLFMLLMAVCFLVIIVRQFVRIPSSKIISASAIATLALFCFGRPDAMIAEYNISRYEQGMLSELDIYTLCNDLSDDAYVVMAKHADTLKNAGKYGTFAHAYADRCSDYKKDIVSTWNISSKWLYDHEEQYTANADQYTLCPDTLFLTMDLEETVPLNHVEFTIENHGVVYYYGGIDTDGEEISAAELTLHRTQECEEAAKETDLSREPLKLNCTLEIPAAEEYVYPIYDYIQPTTLWLSDFENCLCCYQMICNDGYTELQATIGMEREP